MGDKYDDASWHSGGEKFPADVPEEAGGTHIGMFVAWAVLAGVGSDDICGEHSDEAQFVAQLRQRSITPGAFIFVLDGKFTDFVLNDEGNAFTRAYYDRYAEDYAATVGGDVADAYYIEDSWATFDRLKPMLDQRLAEWRASR
ncbi:MAG: hypothetical protein JO257_07380 [Deltaproteobacteria bacterium]|nr:hypothetical protein [Deltaproteobacteria bacterium]